MKTKRLGAQAILVKQKRFGYFPQVFVWHGRTHRVVECRETRTVSRWGLFGRVERRYFRACCTNGACELYQDLMNNTWHIQNPMLDVRRNAGGYAGFWGGESHEAGAAVV
jgi:hypothetical protein